jgi:hypothetical protein
LYLDKAMRSLGECLRGLSWALTSIFGNCF